MRWIYVLSCRYELDEKFYICLLHMKLGLRDSFKDTSFSRAAHWQLISVCLDLLKTEVKKNPQFVVLHGQLINQTWYKMLISEIWKVLGTRLLTFGHSRRCYLLLPVFNVNWANCPPAVASYLDYRLIQSLLCNKGNKQISMHFWSLNRTSLH